MVVLDAATIQVVEYMSRWNNNTILQKQHSLEITILAIKNNDEVYTAALNHFSQIIDNLIHLRPSSRPHPNFPEGHYHWPL